VSKIPGVALRIAHTAGRTRAYPCNGRPVLSGPTQLELLWPPPHTAPPVSGFDELSLQYLSLFQFQIEFGPPLGLLTPAIKIPVCFYCRYVTATSILQSIGTRHHNKRQFTFKHHVGTVWPTSSGLSLLQW